MAWLEGQGVLTSLLLLTLITVGQCSEGSEHKLFLKCMEYCNKMGCVNLRDRNCDVACPHLNDFPVPLDLRIMGWDCLSDCKYVCMTEVQKIRLQTKSEIHKYYGKWPFTRVAGMQEFGSVMFSIGNLLAHGHCLYHYITSTNKAHRVSQLRSPASLLLPDSRRNPIVFLWIGFSLIFMNSWFWSAIFHARDTKMTERFDYCSASLTIAYGLYAAIVRVFGIQNPRLVLIASISLILAVAYHWHYMLFVLFDYDYNMKVCLVVGVMQGVLWLMWSSRVRHPGRKTLLMFLFLSFVAVLLEVLDFPPIFELFDAHCLWHAATIPLTYLFYSFLRQDIVNAPYVAVERP